MEIGTEVSGAKAPTAKICWQYEDEIEITIGPEMFQSSRIIDGVRMYPYVSIYGNIFYLLEE